MSNAEALATAARDAGVPVKKLLNVIAHSSPEIGVELMSSVLAESKYSPDAPLTKFMGAK